MRSSCRNQSLKWLLKLFKMYLWIYSYFLDNSVLNLLQCYQAVYQNSGVIRKYSCCTEFTGISIVSAGMGKEWSLSEPADDIKLSGIADMIEGRNAVQTDLDRLVKQVHINLMKVSMSKFKVLNVGHVNFKHPYQNRKLTHQEQTCGEWSRCISGWKAEYVTGMHSCILENKWYPELYKKYGQKVKGHDYPPLLCCHKILSGELCSDLAPQQKTHVGLLKWVERKATKIMRGLEYLAYKETLRVVVFSLENRRLQSDLTEDFQCLVGAYKKYGGRLFTKVFSVEARYNSFNWKWIDLD